MPLLKGITDVHTIVFSTEPHQPRNFNFPKREFGRKYVVSKTFRLISFQSGPGFTIAKMMIQYREDNNTLATNIFVIRMQSQMNNM